MAYREKTPAVYILASKRNGTIYTGVTSDLYMRVPQHRQGLIEGFTKTYRVHRAPVRSSTAPRKSRGATIERERLPLGCMGPGLVPLAHFAHKRRRDDAEESSVSQTLFPLLVNARWRRLSLLSDGTHGMALEKHRMLLFRTVQQFLEEPPPAADAKF